MNKEQLFEWVKEEFGVEPDYPWMDENAILRHQQNQKWFAAVLSVRRDKLGLSGVEPVDVVNLKSDPNLIGVLRMQSGYHPAYHMNKEKWISIRLDGTVPDEEIKNLLTMSFFMTQGLPKARKRKESAP